MAIQYSIHEDIVERIRCIRLHTGGIDILQWDRFGDDLDRREHRVTVVSTNDVRGQGRCLLVSFDQI